MSRKVSIQTLADQLGLSKYAVSRALSGKTGVSESTRARVLELARALGYRQNTPGSTGVAVAADQSEPPFALICMNQLNRGEPHYWQRVLSGMISGCNERGWHHAIVSPSLGTGTNIRHRNGPLLPIWTGNDVRVSLLWAPFLMPFCSGWLRPVVPSCWWIIRNRS